MSKTNPTAWQKIGSWYDTVVGYWGSHYHQTIVIPKSLALLHLTPKATLLDLACGQGVLARHIPKEVSYVGIDAAKSLIQKARSYQPDDPRRKFYVADITKGPLPITTETHFSHASCILAIQNIEHPKEVFENAARYLLPGAVFLLVLNHPCFRIPRQSGWGFEEASKTQVRKVHLYMTPQKIPISAHPSQKDSEISWTFHRPLSFYFELLSKTGFCIRALEEWCSDKTSTGKAASWENRARKEFPLFLAIKAEKLSGF
jgi:ubiquinone/menaquinone biosynthesis C-methylase UbiE